MATSTKQLATVHGKIEKLKRKTAAEQQNIKNLGYEHLEIINEVEGLTKQINPYKWPAIVKNLTKTIDVLKKEIENLHNNSADGDTGGRTEAFLNCIKELEKVSEDTTMWPDKTKTLGETLRALDKEPGNLGGKDEQSVKLLLKLINDIEKEIAKGTKTVETKGEIR